MRIAKNGVTVLQHQFDRDTDTPDTPDSAVTLTVKSLAGAAIGGPYATIPVTPTLFEAVVPSGLSLGVVDLEWNTTVSTLPRKDVDRAEIVGSHMFTILEARAGDLQLNDAARFPAEEIRQKRDIVATEFELISGRSFVSRSRDSVVTTTGQDAAWLGMLDVQALTAVTVDGTTKDVANYQVDENGVLSGLSGLPAGCLVVATVTYGFPTPPADISRSALMRLRSLIAWEKSGIPDRATTYEPAEGGSYRMALPGQGGFETAIPEVDATLSRYRMDVLYDVLGVAG